MGTDTPAARSAAPILRLFSPTSLFTAAVLILTSNGRRCRLDPRADARARRKVPALGGGGTGARTPSFDVPEVFSTGFQEVETTDGRQTGVNADYGAVWAGDRMLLVKTKPGPTSRRIVGELKPAPEDIVAGVLDLPEDKRELILPLMDGRTKCPRAR